MTDSTIRTEAADARAGHQYQPEEFIDRQDMVEIVESILEGARPSGQQPTRSVIALSGVQGIGKSWLLQHLLYLSRGGALGQGRNGATRRATAAAYASFMDLGTDLHRTPVALIDTLHTQFTAALQNALPAVRAAAGAVEKALAQARRDDDHPADLAAALVELVTAIGEQATPILLLDALELLPYPSDLFHWLENDLLAPLAATDRAIIVLAARKEIRVRSFELRRRFLPIRLQPFDSEDTLRQVARICGPQERAPAARKSIYTYSLGHPYTTWKLCSQTAGALDESASAEAVRTLREVETMLLQDASEPLRARLRLVSVLRKFNVNSLRLLLAVLEDPALREQKDPYFLETIDDMVRSNLVFWNQRDKAYVMDTPVRQIMNRLLRLQDPAVYRQRQQAALEIYRQWVLAYPGIVDFMVEALYHLAARDVTPDGRAPAAVWEEMEALLTDIFRRDDVHHHLLPEAEDLYEALRHDRELAALLPDDLWDRLMEWVEALTD
jgi:hypothetical protein